MPDLSLPVEEPAEEGVVELPVRPSTREQRIGLPKLLRDRVRSDAARRCRPT
jgi:hypothetical protein